MPIAVFTDELFLKHEIAPGHPESPDRLRAVYRMLDGYPRREALSLRSPRDATDEELRWVHTGEHLERVKSTAALDHYRFDLDTAVNSHSAAAARRAVGAVVSAVEAPAAHSAFALVRPPGHHAERNQAMGFCLFNNVAVAAEYARRVLSLSRVAIFDWDVHHGNGTQHSFYDRDDVLYASIHQAPFYPGTGSVEETGTGAGAGLTVNMPLDPGAGDYEYLYLMDGVLRKVLRRFRPELLIVSAGFDPHGDDPLAHMRVSTDGFGRMTELLLDVLSQIDPTPRIVLALEGGYDIDALADGVSRVLDALSGVSFGWRDVLDGGSPSRALTSMEGRLAQVLHLPPGNR